jgi:DGQHR domain-containing protein
MSTALKLKTNTELIENLTEVLYSIEHNRNKTKKLKEEFKDFNVSPGEVQKILNDPKQELQLLVEQNNVKFICVLTICTFNVTFSDSIDPLNYFTDREVKEIKSTYQGNVAEKLLFPLTIPNVIRVAEDDYICTMTANQIKEWQDSNLFQYNFETQREARLKADKDSGEIIFQPKVNPKSIEEIVELMKKGKAIRSVLTFNARLGTSDNAEELIYNDKDHTLTITDGTLLDILDGFHRLTSITLAISQDPSLDMTFKINIVNFSVKQAQEFFAQLNTTNPIAQGRLKEMKESRQADFIVKQVQANSELNEYITKSDRISPRSNILVTFNALSDAIHEVFDVKDKPTAMEIADFLSEFFDKLMLNNSKEFMTDIANVREKSLININAMFYGYVVLAKKFYDQKLKLAKLQPIIKSIDFSRDNEMWKFLGILDDNKNVTSHAGGKIIDYFKNLNIE